MFPLRGVHVKASKDIISCLKPEFPQKLFITGVSLKGSAFYQFGLKSSIDGTFAKALVKTNKNVLRYKIFDNL